MSSRLHAMRGCIALRIAMRHLERAGGPRIEQAVELCSLAAELLAEEGLLTQEDLEVLDGETDGDDQTH